MKNDSGLIAVLLVVILISDVVAAQEARLNFSAVKNAILEVDGETVPLKDGRFIHPHAPRFEKWSETYELLQNPMALGDFDRDGYRDALVIVAYSGGGSGTFYYLQLLSSDYDGLFKTVASSLLGDRIQVKRLQVNSQGVISVNLVRQGPQDPLSRPTMSTVERYRLLSSLIPHFERIE